MLLLEFSYKKNRYLFLEWKKVSPFSKRLIHDNGINITLVYSTTLCLFINDRVNKQTNLTITQTC